ncbi:MAG: zinc-ribbon domain-containing protein [Cuniculiplasma sp.]
MFCTKCGAQLPDDAVFCSKCGNKVGNASSNAQNRVGNGSTPNGSARTVVAASGVTELKCPGCGAPIKPVQGEAVITCEYCGTSVTLGNTGWTNVSRHTMLNLTVQDTDLLRQIIKKHLDKGILERHTFEESKEEELTLTYVPYWIVPTGANSSFKYLNVAAEVGTLAMDAAVMGVADEAMGGRGGGMGGGMIDGMMIGGMIGGGMGGNNAIRGGTFSQNYEFPVLAIKDKPHLQPDSYHFKLDQRIDFDQTKIMKSLKVLNGDVDEDTSKEMAKTLVSQLQETIIRQKHHHLEALQTQCDVGTPELLHVPIWQGKYSHKKKEFYVIVDGSDGQVMKTDLEKVK